MREKVNPRDISEKFNEAAAAAGIEVSQREIRFPERRVLLAKATTQQLTQIENLFDMLAELRLAKHLATEFVEMPPREQAGVVEAAIGRIEWPSENAPAVCHLDTGVNRGHPLIENALSEDNVLAVDPEWSTADLDGHGTSMAGIALFDCLTQLLTSDEPIVLTHRLESVKILPDEGENDPDLYGDITNQAASRITIAAPNRTRTFCLTVTADSRDEGFPSSWSAAIDALCAGVADEERHLMVVSAGNIPMDQRHECPERNSVSGIEDPSQAWNVLTVGAYTEKTTIHSPDCANWKPIADANTLSPGSRTSQVWGNKSWPLKPDIVMEGGNNAIDPFTKRADFVDDLQLLTTRVSLDGALFTTTGDTSAATALAARYAAIVQSQYPTFWPETVRALLVHSARWTDPMLAQYPHKERHERLRFYGYGVPDLNRALWSAKNATTLIIQESLQPYAEIEETKDGKTTKKIKTKDMHVHRLPWPTQVLQDVGDTDVTLRVTLSYFIEPSPGRRGWTRRHRYQSFGLRFEVKRPLETDEDFRKRLSKDAQDEDQDVYAGGDDRNWTIGPNLRSKGSIHSDTWTGTAAELAACGSIGVLSVTGWWRERKHLGLFDRQARYSLIVSIETDDTNVDLYTTVANLLGIEV